MPRTLGAVLAIGGVAWACAAQAAPAPRVGREHWAAQPPTAAELRRLLPPSVLESRQGGLVAVECDMDEGGRLSGCAAEKDFPNAPAFVPAAIALGPRVVDVPTRLRGKPMSHRSMIVLRFGFSPDGEPAVDLARITAPDWLRKPTPEELHVVWPAEAWRRGQGGMAVVNCLVTLQGRLTACRADKEDPPGKAFGAAAIALTPQMLMKPMTVDGTPIQSRVSVPVTFEMPAGARGDDSPPIDVVRAAIAWEQAPSVADMAALYPAKAKAAGAGGAASLECNLNRKGELTACAVMTEQPKELGFGAAAKALSKRFRAPATLSNGRSVAGAIVHLPVTFAPEVLKGAAVVGKTQWAALPDADAARAAFADLDPGLGAVRAVLTCKVQQSGAVGDCQVESEQPAGKGVGERAKVMATGFRMVTWTAEGLPTVGATVRIPIRYQVNPDVASAPAPAKP